ncbi:juvenile hormone esterase-like [Leptidea sinapis]|uniref:juvenile hormone esterase-like n=1 Tax=Leptidea sinapis TaxID=189913 RepID=UPI0021378EF6|nr:juvenile hormone esterase-like [Leptidea sinapis]
MASPIIVSEGKLQGYITETESGKKFFVFKGIPYAKPPIDELRFAAPLPSEPWEGVRDATKNSNICAQLDRATKTVVGDEDCLYLNISSPKLPNSNDDLLPVMVFFHGGVFLFGNGTDDSIHGPDFLVEKDVVVVSLNYRLGILGFLCLDRSDAPGNMGLKDQVQALKWIQKNIKEFGGNPENVTIFGISAGGASVEYLMLSPMAKGLFHKVIAQSGSSLLPWAQTSNIKKIAAKLPVLKNKIITDDDELLKYLKSLSTNDLIITTMLGLAIDVWRGGINFSFVPTVESPGDWEPFISKSTYEMLSNGEFTKVPYMAGCCDREGLLLIPLGTPLLEKLKKEKKFTSHLPFDFGDSTETENARLKSLYMETESKYIDPDSYAIDFLGDVDFLGGVFVSTMLIAKNNSPVYFYDFAYDGNLNFLKKKMSIDRKGASHGDEIGYLVKSAILTDPLSETDMLIRNRLCQLWTNFAKFGNPTPKTDDVITTIWEPFAEPGQAYLYIDDKLTMKHELYPERMKLFKELYEKYYKL